MTATFLKYKNLPRTSDDAKNAGWTSTAVCQSVCSEWMRMRNKHLNSETSEPQNFLSLEACCACAFIYYISLLASYHIHHAPWSIVVKFACIKFRPLQLFHTLYTFIFIFSNFSYFLDDAYFRGNRYILNDDSAVMLLYDSNGKIAGIQCGVSISWNNYTRCSSFKALN